MLFVSTLYRAVYALDRNLFFPPFPSDGMETSERFSFFPSFSLSVFLFLFLFCFFFFLLRKEREKIGRKGENLMLC